MLRSAVFAKYPGLPISKSYDQNKFSCFPLMKTARINEKGGLYKGENLACSHVRIQDPKKKAAHEAGITRRDLHGFSPAFADLSRTVPRLSVSSFRSIGSDPEELEPRKAEGPVMQSLSSSSTSYFTFWGEIL